MIMRGFQTVFKNSGLGTCGEVEAFFFFLALTQLQQLNEFRKLHHLAVMQSTPPEKKKHITFEQYLDIAITKSSQGI